MDKEKLIKLAEDLYQSAFDANAYYAIMMQYREMSKKYNNEMNLSPAFYQVVYGALQKACFMEIAKLYGTRSIASTSKIKSRLTAALVINSFESRPADLVTTVTDHPERTGRYHPYVSESLLRDIRSNHTVLGCLPLLFPQCCR